MSKHKKHKQGGKRYVLDGKYHMEADLEDSSKTLWKEAMCGNYVQFSRQKQEWDWCKECLKEFDEAHNLLRRKRTKVITTITEQKFNPAVKLLQRIAKDTLHEAKVKSKHDIAQKPVARG